jgi:hypothetical protein
MTSAEYSSTREYRDRLSRTLEMAKTRLSSSNFGALAQGIEQEISRLDGKLSEHPLYEILFFEHDLPGSWAPVSVKMTSMMIAPESVSVRFNSPVATSPWTSQIKHYEGSYQIQASQIPCVLSCGR